MGRIVYFRGMLGQLGYVAPILLLASCAQTVVDSDKSAADAPVFTIVDSQLPDSGEGPVDAAVHPDALMAIDAAPDAALPDAHPVDGPPLLPTPMINEFVFNHTHTDSYEFVEVHGAPNSNYSLYTLVVIDSDPSTTGTITAVLPVGNTGSNGKWFSGYTTNVLQNGSQALLLVANFSGSVSDDLDWNNDGTLEVTPWTYVADSIAVLDAASHFTYGAPALTRGLDGNLLMYGGASRIPDATDTNSSGDWTRNDFDGWGLPLSPQPVYPNSGEALNTPATQNLAALGPQP